MNALILNALSLEGERGRALHVALLDLLEAHAAEVRCADIPSLEVKPCLGCSHCSYKKPGICVHRDDLAPVIARIPHADLLVLAGPVRFGTWHPGLKIAIDRFLPLIAPYYTRRFGELHHRMRYERPCRLLTVGLLRDPAPDAEPEAFRHLAERHARNWDISRYATVSASAPPWSDPLRHAQEVFA